MSRGGKKYVNMQDLQVFLTKIQHSFDNEEAKAIHTSDYDGKVIYCGSKFSQSFLRSRVSILTHYGKFHMDELVAICMLLSGPLVSEQEIVIVRSRDVRYLDICDYVVDVGREYDPDSDRFDHHQPNFNIMYNDYTHYASAGLVFMKYGEEVISNILQLYADVCLISNTELFDYVYADMHVFTKYIDNLDNGQKVTTSTNKLGPSASWVSGLNPVRMFSNALDSEYTHNFLIALTSLRLWFKNYIVKSAAMWLGMKYLDELMKIPEISNEPYLIIPYDLPWKELMWKRWNVLSKFSFVIVGGIHTDTWSIHNVPTSPSNFQQYKVNIPRELLGKYGEELEEITGISDLVVCNANGYVAYAKTKTAAMSFANYVYNKHLEKLDIQHQPSRIITEASV